MTKLREAAQDALETLEQLHGGCTDSDDGTVEAITVWCPEIINALRAALTEPERTQGPVGWQRLDDHDTIMTLRPPTLSRNQYRPLYDHPASDPTQERDEVLKANSMLLKAASDMEEQRDAARAENERLVASFKATEQTLRHDKGALEVERDAARADAEVWRHIAQEQYSLLRRARDQNEHGYAIEGALDALFNAYRKTGKFSQVFCSQCGGAFLHHNYHGYSHCEDHIAIDAEGK